MVLVASVLSFLQIIFFVLIILIILTQTVTIRITKEKDFLLHFNFTFLAFTINPVANNSKKERKKNTVLPIIKTFILGIEHSYVEINALDFNLEPDGEAKFLWTGLLNIPKGFLLAYIEQKAISFKYSPKKEDFDGAIDISLDTTFYHLIYAFAWYFREKRRLKIK